MKKKEDKYIYLEDFDKEFAEIFISIIEKKNSFIKEFYEKDINAKKFFLNSILDKIENYLKIYTKPYRIYIHSPGALLISRKYPYPITWYAQIFITAYEVLTISEKTYVCGWNYKHGNIFVHYENKGNNLVFESFFSDGHPQKEFRNNWNYFNENKSFYLDKLILLETTTNRVKPIDSFFMGFFSKKEFKTDKSMEN